MIMCCQQLYNAANNPAINIISLELLRGYYETYLNPFIYKFEITDTRNTDTKKIIELRFDQDSFCHLLGIESTLKYNINRSELPKYTGQNGWDNIKNNILNFDFLKDKNKKGFKNNKTKYVFFYLIPKLMEKPKGVLFDSTKVTSCKVECELLFYDLYQKAYIHIGIDYSESKGYYIPRTFLIEKITNGNDGLKYINDQIEIKVNKIAKNSN